MATDPQIKDVWNYSYPALQVVSGHGPEMLLQMILFELQAIHSRVKDIQDTDRTRSTHALVSGKPTKTKA